MAPPLFFYVNKFADYQLLSALNNLTPYSHEQDSGKKYFEPLWTEANIASGQLPTTDSWNFLLDSDS